MAATIQTLPENAEPKRLNLFERYLTVWVGLCMIAGLLLGEFAPSIVDALRTMEFGKGSQVNVPIAVLIWLMIIPMMMKVDFGAIRERASKKPRGLLVTLFVNWLVKPFSMALISWVVLPAHLQRLDSKRSCGPVHRRNDHSGSRALHRHGVRLELPDGWRSRVHARAGFSERPDHALSFCTDRAISGQRSLVAARSHLMCCSIQ